MLFKVLFNICNFLKVISFKEHILLNNILHQTTYYFQEHILLYNMYGVYDMYVQQHKYVYQQHMYVVQFHMICIYCRH